MHQQPPTPSVLHAQRMHVMCCWLVCPMSHMAMWLLQVEVQPGADDDAYLPRLEQALRAAAAAMPSPHLIVYNAGTDILAGDPLGRWGTLLAALNVMTLSGQSWVGPCGMRCDSTG